MPGWQRLRTRMQGRPAGYMLAIGSTFVALSIGYALKIPCTSVPQPTTSYPRYCYSDIQAFAFRGLQDGTAYLDYRLEYPVVIGYFIDATGGIVRLVSAFGPGGRTATDYLRVTALLLGSLALAVTLMLRPRVSAVRLVVWSFGPPLILYGFLNWDLIAVAASVWAIVRSERGHYGWAGAALGVGTSAKLYPVLFVPVVALARIAQGDRDGAVRVVAGALSTMIVLNAPVMILAPRAWFAIWTFHIDRPVEMNSLWFWILRARDELLHHPGSATTDRIIIAIVGLCVFAVGAILFLRRGWKRRDERQGFPLIATCLGITVMFLLASKVYSPQYTLWILPFVVLLDIRWWIVGGVLVTDVCVFLTTFVWGTIFDTVAPGSSFAAVVVIRTAMLVVLAWSAMRANVHSPGELGPSAATPAFGARPPPDDDDDPWDMRGVGSR